MRLRVVCVRQKADWCDLRTALHHRQRWNALEILKLCLRYVCLLPLAQRKQGCVRFRLVLNHRYEKYQAWFWFGLFLLFFTTPSETMLITAPNWFANTPPLRSLMNCFALVGFAIWFTHIGLVCEIKYRIFYLYNQ